MTTFWEKLGVPLEITEMIMPFRFPLAFPDTCQLMHEKTEEMKDC